MRNLTIAAACVVLFGCTPVPPQPAPVPPTPTSRPAVVIDHGERAIAQAVGRNG